MDEGLLLCYRHSAYSCHIKIKLIIILLHAASRKYYQSVYSGMSRSISGHSKVKASASPSCSKSILT